MQSPVLEAPLLYSGLNATVLRAVPQVCVEAGNERQD